MDLFFSDIHADADSLEAIIEIASDKEFVARYGSFDRIINLGDILERGTKPRQAIKKLCNLSKEYEVISVMGNHDEAFLYKRPVSGSSIESSAAHDALTQDDLSIFDKNGNGTYGKQEFVDWQNRILCVHGGPLEPEKIIPKSAPQDEFWLYQKTWQRISEEDFEFFSYSGYHYTPRSAFDHAKKRLGDGFVILCGHQHAEGAIREDTKTRSVCNILNSPDGKGTREEISNYSVSKKEFLIQLGCNYIFRVGIGGPEGYFGKESLHFGVIQYFPLENKKKVVLISASSHDT